MLDSLAIREKMFSNHSRTAVSQVGVWRARDKSLGSDEISPTLGHSNNGQIPAFLPKIAPILSQSLLTRF